MNSHRISLFAMLISGTLAASCSSLPKSETAASDRTRHPAQAEVIQIDPIVLKSSKTSNLCPDEPNGSACRTTWQKAVNYCKSIQGHLPTAREYADVLRASGTKTLERVDVSGAPPAGYYGVDCKNEDGSSDFFYMNHSEYVRPATQNGNHLLWTASTPPGHAEYAHVYYDEWGGGGGNPADHLKSKLNSFQCAPNYTAF